MDFAGCADENTPDTNSSNIESRLDNLQGVLEKMFHWLSTNTLVANAGKCHLLTSSKKPADIYISNTEILNEQKVKSYGVNLQSRLIFDLHVNTLSKKASNKYHALAKVCNYMNKKKQRMNAFITFQFSYCPLVWMSRSRI